MQSENKDVNLLAQAFHPRVVVHEPTSLPYAGKWTGLDGVAKLMDRMKQCFSDVQVKNLRCAGSPDMLLASCELCLTARPTGISIRQPFVEVLRFDNGLLIEGTPHYFDTNEIRQALAR